jgi:hypothetical protein
MKKFNVTCGSRGGVLPSGSVASATQPVVCRRSPQAPRSRSIHACCVLGAYDGIKFPKPESGIVTVIYPMTFAPE